MRTQPITHWMRFSVLVLLIPACQSFLDLDNKTFGDALDSNTVADTETNTDTIPDTASDTDTYSDTDSSTDTDTDSDTDTTSESDTNSDTDTVSDTESDTQQDQPTWVALPGSTFLMGSEDGSGDEKPVHGVMMPTFDVTKTEITVTQYQACVAASACTMPSADSGCRFWETGTGEYPVNCVSWDQGQACCLFFGGRLLTESEWEYAASSGGTMRPYPWGTTPPDCTTYANFNETGPGCGTNGTLPVCAKAGGNTPEGLCDMAGNVAEWVQDYYQSSYDGAPTDGSAFNVTGSLRVVRGGSFESLAMGLRNADRAGFSPGNAITARGIRCAR